MQTRETLREEIEKTRARLDRALAEGTDVESYYRISVELDKLIEEYIDFAEREPVRV